MRTRTWCVVGALLLCSVPTAGQTVLSEQDALARLSSDSPRVRAIQAGVELVRADVPAAGRWPNPRLTFNRETVLGVAENIVMVTQALPVTGRRDFELSAVSALVAASQSRADEQVRLARAELRAAYADLVSAQTREAELARSRDRVRALADVLARREAAGEAAGTTVSVRSVRSPTLKESCPPRGRSGRRPRLCCRDTSPASPIHSPSSRFLSRHLVRRFRRWMSSCRAPNRCGESQRRSGTRLPPPALPIVRRRDARSRNRRLLRAPSPRPQGPGTSAACSAFT